MLKPLAWAAVLATAALLAPQALALDGWLKKRDDGLEAAKKSGKPVLVVTIWKDGV